MSYRDEYRSFADYCRTLTDGQLLAVISKERKAAEVDPDREAHADAAQSECDARVRGAK